MILPGDMVLVKASTDATARTIQKYRGQKFVVKHRTRYVNGSNYYTLYGAESDKGVSYCFAEDWLEKVKV